MLPNLLFADAAAFSHIKRIIVASVGQKLLPILAPHVDTVEAIRLLALAVVILVVEWDDGATRRIGVCLEVCLVHAEDMEQLKCPFPCQLPP